MLAYVYYDEQGRIIKVVRGAHTPDPATSVTVEAAQIPRDVRTLVNYRVIDGALVLV